MMSNNVLEKISAQQAGKEGTPVWMVGEQLKDICRNEPLCGEIIAQDLEVEGMSLEKAAAQIKAYADKQPRKGNCVCVPPNVAEDILRKFYGLPERSGSAMVCGADLSAGTDASAEILNLADFL